MVELLASEQDDLNNKELLQLLRAVMCLLKSCTRVSLER